MTKQGNACYMCEKPVVMKSGKWWHIGQGQCPLQYSATRLLGEWAAQPSVPVADYICPQCKAGDHSIHDKSVYRLGCQNDNCNCIIEVTGTKVAGEMPPLDHSEDWRFTPPEISWYRQRERQLLQSLSDLQRATDLIRHQRHALLEDKLISQEEYAALVSDSDNSQRVARLEGYDAICADLRTAQEELKEMTSDRNLWRDEHNGDCPNLARAERLESENSSLRQSHNLQVETINAQAKRIAEMEAK